MFGLHDWIKQFWEELLKEIIGVSLPTSLGTVTLHDSYTSVTEFLTMAVHLMASHELNSCITGH